MNDRLISVLVDGTTELYEGGVLLATVPPGGDVDAVAAATFSPESAPVPEKTSLWRAKAILHNDGLLERADAAVAASGNPALIAFWSGGGSEVYRLSPSLVSLATNALHLTDAQVDDLFRRAEALTL